MSEIETLRAEVERLRALIDSRPALNAGLFETYMIWTALCYVKDQAPAPEDSVH